LQKSVPAPPKKNFKIFFHALLKKIKTPNTQALTMQTADKYRHDNWTTEAHAHNKGSKEMAGKVVTQT
jgi:hypothetical protein